ERVAKARAPRGERGNEAAGEPAEAAFVVPSASVDADVNGHARPAPACLLPSAIRGGPQAEGEGRPPFGAGKGETAEGGGFVSDPAQVSGFRQPGRARAPGMR